MLIENNQMKGDSIPTRMLGRITAGEATEGPIFLPGARSVKRRKLLRRANLMRSRRTPVYGAQSRSMPLR